MARTMEKDSEVYRAVAVFKGIRSKWSPNPGEPFYSSERYFGPHLNQSLCKAAVTRKSHPGYEPVHVKIQIKKDQWETVSEWYENEYARFLQKNDGVDRTHLIR